MRSHVKIYFDFDALTNELNDAEKGSLLLAVVRYAETGEVPTLSGNERFLFPVFKQKVDEDIKAYDTKVQNGSNGGRPASEPKQTETNRNEPKETEENREEPKETENAKKEERRKKIEDKRKKNQNENVRDFDRFWAAYPRKTAKPDALKAFLRINPDPETVERSLAAVEKQRASPQWTRDDGQYIPYPATWLNGRRWEDEVQTVSARQIVRTVTAQNYEQRDYDEPQETPEQMLARLQAEAI